MPHVFLHVEDDADFHLGLKMRFEAAGHNLVAVPYAEATVDEFENRNPAGVIFDVYMSMVSGLEGLRALLNAHPDARYVVLTNYKKVIEQEAADLAIPPERVFLKTGEGDVVPLLLTCFQRQGLDL